MAGCSIIRKRNLPPSPYTDAELVGFMDRNGLGTVATRANIIRTLLERKYIRYSGKYVIPTPKGLFFYETVRGMKIADASLTSGWEAELAQIERGERTPEEFLDGVLELVKGITGEIRRIHARRNDPRRFTGHPDSRQTKEERGTGVIRGPCLFPFLEPA